ncbi:MAG: glutamyl-Q tRNA(Asp) synthetase [Paracoccaceae bacterium]|jgi:glutamyl-Q tRNA(Asp) synthetase
MRTRFAPSPTGLLHLGHAYSALVAWQHAQQNDMEFLLRIEDIDQTRSRTEFETAIFDDLIWLGISWPQPVVRQSERLLAYQAALDFLINKGLCYPCRCTRRDITLALGAPQEGVSLGPDGPIYPGTCRDRSMNERDETDAIRLNIRAAIQMLDRDTDRLEFIEHGSGNPVKHTLTPSKLIAEFGDVVLARRHIGTSYHLAVVVDDAAQNISHVTRGNDMFDATKIHCLLQALLGLPVPEYYHHQLIRDQNGKRLAKRDDARAIRKYRLDGSSPADIQKLVGL